MMRSLGSSLTDLVMVLLCVSTTVFRSVSRRNGSWK